MIRRLPMIALALLSGGMLALASRGPAADTPRRPIDPQTRARLEANLAAFHHLSPAKQAAMRQLDKALHDEDAITRQRLFGVMHRFAGWLSRLPTDDRRRLVEATASADRLRLVRETLDRQWFADLPKAQRDAYTARPSEQAALLEKWKAEDRERRTMRAEALRDIEFGATGLPFGDPTFRGEVQKFVREVLEPKLTDRERKQLNQAWRVGWLPYAVKVANLSESKGLKPPGSAEQWRKLAERRPRAFPPPE
jgi:hypothetical protein